VAQGVGLEFKSQKCYVCVYRYINMYLTLNLEISSDICNDTNNPGGHYTKWNS
jgi:hypothetical protein